MRLGYSAAVLVVAMMGMGGCSHTSNEATTPLIPAVDPPVADVPIPAGFRMTGDSTSKVESTGLRFVNHLYVGSDDILPVVRFYKDEMPKKGWGFVDQTQMVDNEIRLHFSKNSEDCVVTVEPGTLHTHVRVQIDPTARNAAH
jgi:hypothetical protein